MSSADTHCSAEPCGCEHASAHRNEPPVVSAANVIPKPGDLYQHYTQILYTQHIPVTETLANSDALPLEVSHSAGHSRPIKHHTTKFKQNQTI